MLGMCTEHTEHLFTKITPGAISALHFSFPRRSLARGFLELTDLRRDLGKPRVMSLFEWVLSTQIVLAEKQPINLFTAVFSFALQRKHFSYPAKGQVMRSR